MRTVASVSSELLAVFCSRSGLPYPETRDSADETCVVARIDPADGRIVESLVLPDATVPDAITGNTDTAYLTATKYLPTLTALNQTANLYRVDFAHKSALLLDGQIGCAADASYRLMRLVAGTTFAIVNCPNSTVVDLPSGTTLDRHNATLTNFTVSGDAAGTGIWELNPVLVAHLTPPSYSPIATDAGEISVQVRSAFAAPPELFSDGRDRFWFTAPLAGCSATPTTEPQVVLGLWDPTSGRVLRRSVVTAACVSRDEVPSTVQIDSADGNGVWYRANGGLWYLAA